MPSLHHLLRRKGLSETEQRDLARFVIVFALTIVGWACLHDVYLMGVEPRHFTEYHRPLLPITNHALLAVQYAAVATFGPGMVFGALTFAASRLGSPRALELRNVWLGFLPVIALVEASALQAGNWARHRYVEGRDPLYPRLLYPDDTAGIAYSQTVNLTAYLAAAVFGISFLVCVWLVRKRVAKS
ncbi:MAG: hypothetical protein ABW223_01265 [Rariglobus sp.]